MGFETRHPQPRAWADWTPSNGSEVVDVAGRRLRVWHQVEQVVGDVVTFTETTSDTNGTVLRVDRASLRFLDVPTLGAFLAGAGFVIKAQYGDWHRGPITGVRVWEITSKEGNRLLRIVRRSTGSVLTWRRAQMVLLSAQGMDVSQIAQITFTSPDRVRDVLHNFNLDGSDALYPRYRGGRPPIFTLAQRRRCPAWRPRGGRLRR